MHRTPRNRACTVCRHGTKRHTFSWWKSKLPAPRDTRCRSCSRVVQFWYTRAFSWLKAPTITTRAFTFKTTSSGLHLNVLLTKLNIKIAGACPADWADRVPAEPRVHAAEVEQVHAGQPPHPVSVPEIWTVTRQGKRVSVIINHPFLADYTCWWVLVPTL